MAAPDPLTTPLSDSIPTGAPPIRSAHSPPVTADPSWRVVALTNIYRLLLPPLLLALQWATRTAPSVGADNPQLFSLICIAYWALGGLVAFAGRGRWPSRRVLVLVNLLLDTSALCTLMYCSGGVASGLGILLVIPVGAMSLLAEGRATLGVAALSAIGLLTQQILAVTENRAPASDYLLAGILGAVLFLVALLAWPVSTRLRESEALVRRQEIDLANLAQLSQYIVQHLRESILVVDPSDGIRIRRSGAGR
jgi:two-component system, NtrC family, sensor histidine kinase PilS